MAQSLFFFFFGVVPDWIECYDFLIQLFIVASMLCRIHGKCYFNINVECGKLWFSWATFYSKNLYGSKTELCRTIHNFKYLLFLSQLIKFVDKYIILWSLNVKYFSGETHTKFLNQKPLKFNMKNLQFPILK
jgi:glutamine synthetase type III